MGIKSKGKDGHKKAKEKMGIKKQRKRWA